MQRSRFKCLIETARRQISSLICGHIFLTRIRAKPEDQTQMIQIYSEELAGFVNHTFVPFKTSDERDKNNRLTLKGSLKADLTLYSIERGTILSSRLV